MYSAYAVEGVKESTVFYLRSKHHHPPRQRPGTCHRCGWAGAVSKVGIVEHFSQSALKGYGCLCVDCRGELFHEHVPFLQLHRAKRRAGLEIYGHRHVA